MSSPPEPVRTTHLGARENRSYRPAALLLVAGLAGSAIPAAGQTEGWVNLAASVVEYDGFLASGALVAAPSIRFDSPRFSAAGLANLTLFESGNSVVQLQASGAWLVAGRRKLRFELSGSAGVASYASESSSGHLLAGGRLHFFGEQAGGWMELTTGHISDGPDGVPLELTGAVWHIRNRVAWLGTVTRTSYGPVKHVDLRAAVRLAGPRVDVEARVGARPWARDTGLADPFTGAYGEVNIIITLSRWTGLSFGGGKYAPDPVRQMLGANYLGVGLRLRPFGPSPPRVPVYTSGVLRGRSIPASSEGPRLELTGEREIRTFRVIAPDAGAVEIMGDFTDWVPVALVRKKGAVWEVSLPVTPGVHRLNLRLDGGPWIVPAGLRLEKNEFGGAAGLLVVP
jgi:hypothetical protein